jgi:hypothetical protein
MGDLKMELKRKWLKSLLFRALTLGAVNTILMFCWQLNFGQWNHLGSPALYAEKFGSIVFASFLLA